VTPEKPTADNGDVVDEREHPQSGNTYSVDDNEEDTNNNNDEEDMRLIMMKRLIHRRHQ